jgi:hypothetical protein
MFKVYLAIAIVIGLGVVKFNDKGGIEIDTKKAGESYANTRDFQTGATKAILSKFGGNE